MKKKEFYQVIKPIIYTDEYQKMKTFIQHGDTTCYKHCMQVSYYSYLFAKKLNKLFNLNLDEEAIVRAALLHDFFLYDWHDLPPEIRLTKMHGFIHPEKAKENAIKYFNVSDKEAHIIENHMWPLTIYRLPKYKEAYVVILVDKYCALSESLEKRLNN